MKIVTQDNIRTVRRFRKARAKMWEICDRMTAEGFSRDEVVEIIDATIRFQDDDDACLWATTVLLRQSGGLPMVNGNLVERCGGL
ncbi:MAG: hypothetical protein KKA05_11850 [Alphaproteobacteria bacterium]|nr:hypothetical protein [Alphaproteobacteria bacterium]